MKKNILFILLLLLPLISNATEKEINLTPKDSPSTFSPRIAVKLNATIFIGVINPAVEFKICDKVTGQIESFSSFYNKSFLGTDRPAVMNIVYFEGRYYFKKEFRGFFVGPNFGLGVWRLNRGIIPWYADVYPMHTYQVGSNFLAGAVFGYQFRLTDHWGIELAWAAGYTHAHYIGFRDNGENYVGLNKSAWWMPGYKAAFNIVYKW